MKMFPIYLLFHEPEPDRASGEIVARLDGIHYVITKGVGLDHGAATTLFRSDRKGTQR